MKRNSMVQLALDAFMRDLRETLATAPPGELLQSAGGHITRVDETTTLGGMGMTAIHREMIDKLSDQRDRRMMILKGEYGKTIAARPEEYQRMYGKSNTSIDLPGSSREYFLKDIAVTDHLRMLEEVRRNPTYNLPPRTTANTYVRIALRGWK